MPQHDGAPRSSSHSPPGSFGPGVVTSVAAARGHHLTKAPALTVRLLRGLGVEGDAHAGATVRHRSRARIDPTAPNLRQVHLLAAEWHDDLRTRGFDLAPGAMGENLTTRGLDLGSLPRATHLHLGPTAVVSVTGLRNPCVQLDRLAPGLMAACLGRTADGSLVRLAGIMGIVRATGDVAPGDPIEVELPPEPWMALEPV